MKRFIALFLAALIAWAPTSQAALKAVAGPSLPISVANGGTGGTTAQGAAQSLNVPYVLYNGGVPFISLSSGSVAANGAISGITALPAIYPQAFCYFPANILATAIAAGWYYCTFSSTTAGVAFLNTYTSGYATAPSSPTAVTDGKGAFTGDTGEEFGPTITVPILGANSALKIALYFTNTNNANAKTYRVRLSGNAGTVFISSAGTNIAGGGSINMIANTGATGKQYSMTHASSAAPTTQILGTVDTSVSTTLVLSLQKATATDNMVLIAPSVELLYGGP